MKTLLLMRHAKSDWGDESLPDRERPLNDRGERDAPRMGRFLQSKNLTPQRIVTSSARRAKATSELLAAAVEHTGEVIVTDELYHAFPEKILGVIRQQPDEVGILLVVGHNPGMQELVARLLGERQHIATATIIRLDCDIARWSDLSYQTPIESQNIWRPKEIDVA